MHALIVKKKISAAPQKMRSLIWNIEAWKKFWSPLAQVEVHYDDQVHQDFSLFLDWQNTHSHVRTVRFLDSCGDIYFFSPLAPTPMITHQGLWRINLDNEGVELEACRWFELPSDMLAEPFIESFKERLERLVTKLEESCVNSIPLY